MGRFAQMVSTMGLAQRGASWELPNRGDEFPPGTIYPPEQGGMQFNPNARLDPSQVEDRRTGDTQGLHGLGGVPPGGGGGGGSWGETLSELAQFLAEQEFRQPQQTEPDQGNRPNPMSGLVQNAGAGLSGLLGLLGGGGGMPGMGVAGGGGGGGDYSGRGFSAAPPGRDLGGRDLSPDLVNFQGVETISPYARLIKAAELKLGMPEISDYAGSDYRSHSEQAALYDAHIHGRHPAPVAPPGQSYHEQGEAIDWNSGWLAANPKVREFFTDHGVVFDVPGEPWHGHLANRPQVGQILRRYGRPQTATRPTGQPIPVDTSRRRRPVAVGGGGGNRPIPQQYR